MSGPTSAREALLIDLVGQMSGFLDRQAALVAVLEAAEARAINAHDRLAAQVPLLEASITAHGEKVQTHAADFVLRRTGEIARKLIELQVTALNDAAQALFLKELDPAIKALVAPLLRVQEMIRESARPWDNWLTHAATAVVASTVTWVWMSGVLRP